ncbi:hypothetical protein [Plantibacter sp. YIM 135347]|uniref:hypothetical protein n=1 Tax=Plantibacter sp. YIM 135347 TaxID=3423919 RepID=UPI003D3271A4
MPDWLITIIVATLAVSGTWIATRFGRMASLEKRIDALERRERRLWLYCRKLIDHIWRGHGAPPPTPPDDLFGDDE